MSRVLLLTADKPLPLCDRQEERTQTVTVGAGTVSITVPAGFAVREHSYYRDAVDELDDPMKPWQYELELGLDVRDLAALRQLLESPQKDGGIGQCRMRIVI